MVRIIENLSFIITSFVTAHINRGETRTTDINRIPAAANRSPVQHMNLNDSLKKEIKMDKEH